MRHRRLLPDVTLTDLRRRTMTGVDAIEFIGQWIDSGATGDPAPAPLYP